MAQYDVYRLRGLSSCVVDCQADLLRDLATRFVLPLVPVGQTKEISSRLSPKFWIEGKQYVLDTPLMTVLPRTLLRDPIVSLADQYYRIVGAIDALQIGV